MNQFNIHSLKYYFFLLTVISLFACNNVAKQKSRVVHNTFIYSKLNDVEKKQYATEAEQLYHKLYGNNLSGGILIAKHGQIVFERYNGFEDAAKTKPIHENSSIHIASVSKTFTAMAVLQLAEKGKLNLDDSVQKFFPAFPYHNISVKLLLNHRSGLPNYLYFLDTVSNRKAKLNNTDVLQYLINQQPAAYAMPNKVFHYCNTNYVLLALIIEKVSQQDFPTYMQNHVFAPLNMQHTYVFSLKDTLHYQPSFLANHTPIDFDCFDGIYGDKNVYSTPKDLLRWDDAMYNNNFLTAASKFLAFTPYSNEKPGKKNYGLGWRLFAFDRGDTTIYHNGWWHGNNAAFIRCVKDTSTIIAISNRYNRAIYAAKQFAYILSAKKRANDELED